MRTGLRCNHPAPVGSTATRAELGQPRHRAQAEPDRREQHVEDEESEGERRQPEHPPPESNRLLRLQRADLCSTWRMIRSAISSIESSETSITGQPSRRWIWWA